jgi:hypothetical protein
LSLSASSVTLNHDLVADGIDPFEQEGEQYGIKRDGYRIR